MYRLLPWALLLIALFPSVWFAFSARELPQLGAHGEDSHYYNAALSLAEGRGYRATSVPGEPRLTRFPPGLPSLAAPFVYNRTVLSLLLWLLAPCSLALVFFWGRQQELSHTAAAWLCLPLGAFPAFVQASANMLPDLLALTLVFATVYVVEQDSRGATLLGAFAGVAAYLTSDALWPGLCAVGLYLVWRRRYLQAALFAFLLLAAVLGWTSFVRVHADPTAEGLLRWYLGGPPSLRWSQFALDGRPAVFAGVLVSAAWWLTRRRRLSAYVCFAVVSAATLPFAESNQAVLLLLLLPLPLAAIATLPYHAVVLGLAALGCLPWVSAAVADLQRHRKFHPVRSQAYFWIDANTPASAQFLATNDALLHAVTRRHGFNPRNLPSPTALAWQTGLDYLLATPLDPPTYQAAVRADPFYETVYEHDGVLIRRRR
jgi:hypothetical protein